MDVFEAISNRRSIRKFKPDPIPEADVRRIIELATMAPSAGNMQMWKFLAVTNRKVMEQMSEVILRKLDAVCEWPEAQPYIARLQAAKGWSGFFADAPVTIVVLGEPYRSAVEEVLEKRGWERAAIDALRQKPDIQSLGAAMENLCLAAHAMKYGTCWMTAPCIAGPEIKELLGIMPPWEVIALLPLGIPDEEPLAKPRKPLEEVLEFIR
ncbi:MAG TPA: nitroreductase family protein [Armatimonadota bacterium]|nr:nitroreductase family protein [Armatimonadota bacterium]